MSPRDSSTAALRVFPDSNVSTFPESRLNGVGLHSGLRFAVALSAAPKGTGVVFRTTYKGSLCQAPALWTRLSGTTRSTALVLRGPKRLRLELRTVEHLMAAVLLSGLQDLFINVESLDGEHDLLELPILDGSAFAWTEALNALRDAPQPASFHRPVWIPLETFELEDEGRKIVITPWAAPCLKSEYRVEIDFGGIWAQEAAYTMDWTQLDKSWTSFVNDVSAARTFGFSHELESLRARGLAKGGSFTNALLLDGDKLVNEGGFRQDSELAAHKLLDAIGDFALLGAPILGRVHCVKAGHSMHFQGIKEAIKSGILVRGTLAAGGEFSRDP